MSLAMTIFSSYIVMTMILQQFPAVISGYSVLG